MDIKAYIYSRVSNAEQQRGDGLRRQDSGGEAWAAANGCVVAERIVDTGVSAYRGTNRKKGRLAEFIARIHAGEIEPGSVLIVESLDRLSREAVVTILPHFLAILAGGVDIVTLSDGQRYSHDGLVSNYSPLFVSLIVMARAHEESKTKSDRVTEAWNKKLDRARAGDPAVLTARLPGWLTVVGTGRERRIVPIEDRAEIVREIFTKTAAGYGRRAIIKQLNDRKVDAFQSPDGWQPSYVAKLIRSRAVLGEYRPRSRANADLEPIENYFPAIVGEALFLRANAAVDSRRKGAAGARGKGVTNLFQGRVRCACGASMASLNKGDRGGGRFYVCSSAARSAGCKNDRPWRFDLVEGMVVARLDAVTVAKIVKEADNEETVTVDDLARWQEGIQFRRKNLLKLTEEGDLGALARYRELGEELKSVTKRLEEAREDLKSVEQLPDLPARAERMRALHAMMEGSEEERTDVRRRLAQELREVWTEIVFTRHQIQGVIAYGPGRRPPPPKVIPPLGPDAKPVPFRRTIVLFDDSPEGIAAEEFSHLPDETTPAPIWPFPTIRIASVDPRRNPPRKRARRRRGSAVSS